MYLFRKLATFLIAHILEVPYEPEVLKLSVYSLMSIRTDSIS